MMGHPVLLQSGTLHTIALKNIVPFMISEYNITTHVQTIFVQVHVPRITWKKTKLK